MTPVKHFKKGNLNLYNVDCMEFMKDKPDNYYDLAIVDPPYGISEKSYRKTQNKNNSAKKRDYNMAVFQQGRPNNLYWGELFRVSRGQIVWGGNYFTDYLKPSRSWVIWDKMTRESLFADVEMAWTSWGNSAKLYRLMWNGMLQHDMKNKEHRVHPTQKPVQLYKWLLKNYAKEGDRILDTHGGSFSSAIAAYYFDCEFDGCELDKDYFRDAIKRVEEQTNQLKLL